MGNFQRSDRGGNRNGSFRSGNRGNRQGFGGGRRDPVTMHKAICDKCKKNCEVPFRPSGDKPIYCNDCFGNKRDFSNQRPRREFREKETQSFAQNTKPNSSEDVKKQLDEMSNKIDRLISLTESLSAIKTPIRAKKLVKNSTKKTKIKKTKKS